MTKRRATKKTTTRRNPSAPLPIGFFPDEVKDARPAYDRGYADAILVGATSLSQGMTNAWIKYPGGSTRATAYVWGFWQAIVTGAAARRRNPDATYRKTHGGLGGDFEIARMKVPDPKRGKAVVMGRVKRVEYFTDKGKGESLYFHDFGREHANGVERGRVKHDRLPLLVFNEDGLMFAGGRYVVREEGIVG